MHAKTAGRLLGVVALAAAFVAVNTNAPFAVTPAEATQAAFDPNLDRSHRKAQAYLDSFYAFALSSTGARAAPRVQVLLGTESVWVEPVSQSSEGFVGVTLGADRYDVQFDRSDVRDWTFLGRNGKMYGSFQTRARLPHLSAHYAAPIRAVLSSAAVPAHW